MKQAPTVAVRNAQRALRIDCAPLAEFARAALDRCLRLRSKGAVSLAGVSAITVVLISDKRMAKLHRKFLGVDGPTDVITFQHGDIFISAETARRYSRRFRTSFENEVRLYIVHGFLHLHGYDDTTDSAAGEMARTQTRILDATIKELRGRLARV